MSKYSDSTRTATAHERAIIRRIERREDSHTARLAKLSFSEFVRKHNARVNEEV